MRNALTVVLMSCLAALATAASAGAYAVHDFKVPFPASGAGPGAIVAAPDGTAWFATDGGIDHIDASGHRRHFRVPNAGAIESMARDADGNIWFDSVGTSIGRLTPGGKVSKFPVDLSPDRYIGELTIGPDGNIWFAAGRQVARMTPRGALTLFGLPRGSAYGVAAGPDGRVWVTTGSDVDGLTTSGKVTTYPVNVYGLGLVAGPDGKLWTGSEGGTVTRIGVDGTVAPPLRVSHNASLATPVMASGPGGRMWIALRGDNEIVDVTTSGRVTEHGPGGANVTGIPLADYRGLASDGRVLWATMPGIGAIARITPAPACTVPSLVGLSLAAARTSLRDGGCVAPGLHRVDRAEHAYVLGQSRKAGTILASSARITIATGHLVPCRPQRHDNVIARDGGTVLIKRPNVPQGFKSQIDVYAACTATAGRWVSLARAPRPGDSDGYDGLFVTHLQVAGTHAALLTTTSSMHGIVVDFQVVTADLANDDHAIVVPLAPAGVQNMLVGAVTDLALARSGALAWIETQALLTGPTSNVVQTVEMSDGRTTAELDSGPQDTLGSLTVDAASVHWIHAGVPTSRPLPPD